MAEALPNTPPDDPNDADVDAAIATCGGDMRATIKALLVANAFLAGEVEAMLAATSSGYSRGRLKQPAKPKQPQPDE
jgi:hypothetical protein